jgi:putative ATPase
MNLAELVRPKEFCEIAGQKHLFSENAPLMKMISEGHLPSMIFYGPPGVGKTTVADILASKTGKTFRRINATVASLSDLRAILAETNSVYTGGEILLYIDEIQYFNKKQQQSLLEYVEDGRVTLICSTTENPYFYVYPALVSRSAVFEFKSVQAEDIAEFLKRALNVFNEKNERNISASDKILEIIANSVGGDVRKAVNMLENLCYVVSEGEIDENTARNFLKNAGQRFDKSGDEYYNSLSALQKSIRGSDENAAIFYLAKILENGGLISACRRLLVIASEDIGLAYPMAVVVTKSCVDSALQLGMPEARIPLAEACILLATAPKSNSAYMAYDRAAQDVRNGKGVIFPRCLQNVHADGYGEMSGQGYLYPHDYPDAYVKQQYLPDELKDRKYYTFGSNKTEQAAKAYRDSIIQKHKKD